MNKIEELIAELCPDGVEYRKLGEICQIKNGRDYKHLESGRVPVYGSGGFMGFCVSKASHVGPTVLLPRKGSISNVFYVEGPIWNVDTVFYTIVNEDKLLTRYFYHVMLDAHIENYSTGSAARPSLTQTALKQIEIPVPPIEVQREIVRILDSFAELEAELEARKLQYTHYRDRLLSGESLEALDGKPVEMMRLGDVCNIQRGASPRPIKKFVTKDPSGVPWIKIGDVSTDGKYISCTEERITSDGAAKSRLLHAGDFVLSNSMSRGRPYILKIDGCIHDGWLSLTNFRNSFNSDFLYHLLKSSSIQRYWEMKINTGSVSNLNADLVKATPIPVPSQATQQKVVSILDRFDALTTSLTDGLPAEIEARRQQYEYYRDRLLDFPRKEDAAR